MIRAFVIDDSAVVRTVLAQTLQAGGIEVLGTAADPVFAWARMQQAWPDVIVLDVEMPRMDGISFLHQLMDLRPTAVVMCSTLTEKGAETTVQALAAGALACITKPRNGLKAFLADVDNGLVAAVKAAARANLRALTGAGATATAARTVSQGPDAGAMARTTDRVVALGLSTGGVQSLEVVLRQLDRSCPGMVVVQHMPERFTASLAARLNTVVDMEVLEARDGDRVIDGRVLIAPGGRHMRLQRSGAQYRVAVQDGPTINHHRPSVDVLFRSVAQCAGRNAVGVLMTGMGDDGARGLKAMRLAGAATAAQDEATSVVFGMPEAAIRLGAAAEVLPLQAIAPWLRQVAGTWVAAAAESR